MHGHLLNLFSATRTTSSSRIIFLKKNGLYTHVIFTLLSVCISWEAGRKADLISSSCSPQRLRDFSSTHFDDVIWSINAICNHHQVLWHLHDDVIKWKHFPCYWPFVREIHRWPVDFPHKGQWRGALMFSLMYAWKKTDEQTVEMPMILDTTELIVT